MRGLIPQPVLRQLLDDAAFKWYLRDKIVQDPHFRLADLADHDGRLEADLDGIRIAERSRQVAWDDEVISSEPGLLCVATTMALESENINKVLGILAELEQSHQAEREVVAALGWISSRHANRWLPDLLQSRSPSRLRLGVAARAVRREQIGGEIEQALTSDDSRTRVRALRAIGETKCHAAQRHLREHLQAEDDSCRFWAAWSAVLLGDKGPAESLKSFVNVKTCLGKRAMQLAPRALEPEDARQWLRGLAQDETTRRFALMGCGVTGDPVYVPTLISQMAVPEQARVAGEAFSMITGVDLAYEDLDTDWPEGFEAGPTEDPADENVELDPDEDLPWPNQELIAKWWQEHGRAFQPGVRYLCGRPISRENCRRVLIEGYQRQRIGAALELALLNPDEPLFEWRAPGWRQQEWLGLRRPTARKPG